MESPSTTRQELWRSFVRWWWGLGNDGGYECEYTGTTRGAPKLICWFILLYGHVTHYEIFDRMKSLPGILWWFMISLISVMETVRPLCDIRYTIYEIDEYKESVALHDRILYLKWNRTRWASPYEPTTILIWNFRDFFLEVKIGIWEIKRL